MFQSLHDTVVLISPSVSPNTASFQEFFFMVRCKSLGPSGIQGSHIIHVSNKDDSSPTSSGHCSVAGPLSAAVLILAQ